MITDLFNNTLTITNYNLFTNWEDNESVFGQNTIVSIPNESVFGSPYPFKCQS